MKKPIDPIVTFEEVGDGEYFFEEPTLVPTPPKRKRGHIYIGKAIFNFLKWVWRLPSRILSNIRAIDLWTFIVLIGIVIGVIKVTQNTHKEAQKQEDGTYVMVLALEDETIFYSKERVRMDNVSEYDFVLGKNGGKFQQDLILAEPIYPPEITDPEEKEEAKQYTTTPQNESGRLIQGEWQITALHEDAQLEYKIPFRFESNKPFQIDIKLGLLLYIEIALIALIGFFVWVVGLMFASME
jgi:hypothetical protein